MNFLTRNSFQRRLGTVFWIMKNEEEIMEKCAGELIESSEESIH